MKRFAIVLTVGFAFTLSAQTPVRMAWQEFRKDPARVASFRKAVAVMKSRSTADPTSVEYRGSWEYWGAMHGYFGTQSPRGTKEAWMAANGYPANSPYWVGVQNLTPPDAIARTVWAQCQHGTPYFFPWHRLYLYYFERVLQKAANDPNLRLPYWDYTDPANVGMPDEFRQQTYVDSTGHSVANPLYEARRAPGWSTNARLDPAITNINSALNIPYFLNSGGFQGTIEQQPHGSVHCAVAPCRNTVMGAVPYSANDPIFYLHHCNIDRMWDCWHSIPNHPNPTGAYLNQ
ncbi:MAG: tyrosinase family protein, partial [Thermoanaerobaculia bacterium]